MPTCENCKKYEHAILEIKLPTILQKKLKKKKAFLCFYCIRTEARSILDPNGYWFQFVFPHRMPTHKSRIYKP